MRRVMLLSAVLAAVLVGCKSREAQVPGKWTSGQLTYTFKEDKTFQGAIGPATLGGTWSFANDKVSVTTKTINGQTISQVVTMVKANQSNPLVAQALKQSGVSVDNIEGLMNKPTELTLSQDAASLSARNPFSGKTVTLKKTEG